MRSYWWHCQRTTLPTIGLGDVQQALTRNHAGKRKSGRIGGMRVARVLRQYQARHQDDGDLQFGSVDLRLAGIRREFETACRRDFLLDVGPVFVVHVAVDGDARIDHFGLLAQLIAPDTVRTELTRCRRAWEGDRRIGAARTKTLGHRPIDREIVARHVGEVELWRDAGVLGQPEQGRAGAVGRNSADAGRRIAVIGEITQADSRLQIRSSTRNSSWNRFQPPKSSMINLYFINERLAKSGVGAGAPSHRSERKPPDTVP